MKALDPTVCYTEGAPECADLNLGRATTPVQDEYDFEAISPEASTLQEIPRPETRKRSIPADEEVLTNEIAILEGG